MINENKISSINYRTRNKILKFNLSFGFVTKLSSMLISFIIVPITISYLDQELYGIWITLISILTWFLFFDIGLGNGLRNKLTISLSNGDLFNARKYISTAYVALTLIVACLLAVFISIIPIINWNGLFNTAKISNKEFVIFAYSVIILFLLNFNLSLINQIYYAYQKSMLVGIIQVLTNTLTLVGIIGLKLLYHQGDLVSLALVYCSSPLIINIIGTVVFFRAHKEVTPSLNYFDKDKINDILSLGAKFLVIQIAGIIIFTTDNFIITLLIGPLNVTPYTLIYKVFNAITILHTIIMTPLWSAFTEAHSKNDFVWMRSAIKKLNLLMIPIVLVIVIIAYNFNGILRLWIKQDIVLPPNLVILIAFYSIISIWNNIYAYFLNGVGKLKISFNISIFIAVINIPLTYYLVQSLKFNLAGVAISNIICLSFGAIMQPIQSYIILSRKSHNTIFDK